MVDIELYAWIVGGSRRTAIMRAMSYPMTPSQILKASKSYSQKIGLSNASDTIRSFVKRGIAECLTPEAKIARMYQLTPKGEEIRTEILKRQTPQRNSLSQNFLNPQG